MADLIPLHIRDAQGVGIVGIRWLSPDDNIFANASISSIVLHAHDLRFQDALSHVLALQLEVS